MSSGKSHSSRFCRFDFGSVIDVLEEEANRVFVEGGGAVKSMVKGALAALGTLGAAGALGSDILSANLTYQYG